MNVKGVAFLARQALVVSERGQTAWDAFVTNFRRREPSLPEPMLPVTKIEVGVFLRFCDELNRAFYGGTPDAYWHFGVAAGKTALGTGQLKGLFQKGEAKKFLQFTPQVYKGYFDSGSLTYAETGDGHCTVTLSGAPEHYYFEGAVFGFAQGALEYLQARWPEGRKMPPSKPGDIVYRWRLE